MINILSIVWSLPGGGVSHYVGSINKLNRRPGINVKHVIIRQRNWQIHLGLVKALAPFEIFIRSRFDPSWLLQLQRLIRQEDCDMLFVHGFNGYLVTNLCKLLGSNIPVVASYHGPYHSPVKSRRFLNEIINRYAIFFLKFIATQIITVTKHAREELINLGCRAEKITAVHNGIENVSPSRIEERNSLFLEMGIPDTATILGTTSGLHPIKGLEYLIRAMQSILAKHPDTHVFLFGTGPLESELRDLVSSMRIENHVHFMGFQEHIEKWLTLLDIFVLPSLSECHSIGLLEAMRAGLPIICTQLPGNLESIRNDIDGMVVPSKNDEALSDAINCFIKHPEYRSSMGVSARKRFETDFTESTMLENTLGVLMKCS